ncbi:MAG: GNAT family N-acetyltransferase, partial [bacterium]|nr:GNAT family N-acetyltransferase [bacterium]
MIDNKQNIPDPDWGQLSVDSEINLSKAYGGIPEKHDHYIHITNPFVPWNGDFNRAVNVSPDSVDGLDVIIREVRDIHRNKKLDPPNRYDLGPEIKIDNALESSFVAKNMKFSEAVFMQAQSQDNSSGDSLYAPSSDEYFNWYRTKMGGRDYFTDEYYSLLKPLQSAFIKVFKPYWFYVADEIVGSVYIADLGGYARLFEVEIEEKHQGRGLGLKMMGAVRHKVKLLGLKYILLETS